MPSYSKSEVVLIRYPFSDLSGLKVRPAVVANAAHVSRDVLIVPLSSRTSSLLDGEFTLSEWKAAGLNVSSAVRRGIYTVHESLIAKRVGKLAQSDAKVVESSLRSWLGLK
jgi:mRNA interferase MazF